STGRAYGMDTVGGAVSSANSLIGGAGTGGSLGMNVQALSLNGVQTGDALVISDAWNCCGLQGAVTLISGATGLAGEVSWRNSLLGMQGTAANQGAGSSLNYTVLPTAGGSEETIHYRPMVWTVGGNSAAYVLSNVRDNADQPLGAIGHSALSVAAGDGSKWRTAGFAGNAAGFSLLGGANG